MEIEKKSNYILHCILHFRLITFNAMNLICKNKYNKCFQVKGKKQLYLALRK